MEYFNNIFNNILLVSFLAAILFACILVKHSHFLNISFPFLILFLLFGLDLLAAFQDLIAIETNLKFILNSNQSVLIDDLGYLVQILIFLVAEIVIYFNISRMGAEAIHNFRSINVIDFENVLQECFSFGSLLLKLWEFFIRLWLRAWVHNPIRILMVFICRIWWWS